MTSFVVFLSRERKLEHNTMGENSSLYLLNKYRKEIMGLAALWICVFHAWTPEWANPNIVWFIKSIGYMGVDIFFLMSGIGMTYAIKKENLIEFYARRAKRLLPAYLIMAIIMKFESPWSLYGFIAHVSGYVFYRITLYDLLWFVPAIGTLYLVFPLFYKLSKKTKYTIEFYYAILVIWLFCSIYGRNIIREDMYLFINRIPVFIIGVIIGLLFQEGRSLQINRGWWTILVITNIVGLYLTYITFYDDYYLIVPYSRFFLPGIMIAISLSLLLAKMIDIINQSKLKKAGKAISVVLGFYGTISYEFYCFQEWLINKIFSIQPDKYWALKYIVLIIADSVLAWIVHNFFIYLFSFHQKAGK